MAQNDQPKSAEEWFAKHKQKPKTAEEWFQQRAPQGKEHLFQAPPGVTSGSPTLPENLPETMLDKGLQAPRYVGGALGGIAGTAVAGPAGGIAGAFYGGTLGGALEQGLRKITSQRPPQSGKELVDRSLTAGGEQAIGEAGGQVLFGALNRTIGRFFNPERLYGSTLGVKGASAKAAESPVRGGLREGVILNREAAQKVLQLRQKLGQEIDDIINQQGATGGGPQQIDVPRMLREAHNKFNELRAEWGPHPSQGSEFETQIDMAEKAFNEKFQNPGTPGTPGTPAYFSPTPGPGAVPHMQGTQGTIYYHPAQPGTPATPGGPKTVTGPEAQAAKKAVYKAERAKNAKPYGPFQDPGLMELTEKAQAEALRSELERVYGPVLKDLNRRQGDVIELEKAIDTFLQREYHMAEGKVKAPPESASGALLRIAHKFQGSPEFRSWMATYLNRTGQKPWGKVVKTITPPLIRQVPRLGDYKLRAKEPEEQQ